MILTKTILRFGHDLEMETIWRCGHDTIWRDVNMIWTKTIWICGRDMDMILDLNTRIEGHRVHQ